MQNRLQTTGDEELIAIGFHQPVQEDKFCTNGPTSRQFNPSGECPSDDISYTHERSPMRISSKYLCPPAVKDANDKWEYPLPEALAATIIYADSAKRDSIKSMSYFPEDTVAMPIRNIRNGQNDSNPSDSIDADKKEEESVLLSASASLFSEKSEKIIQPVKASVLLHRRKRLEWNFPNTLQRTLDRKSNTDGNSWTVYDDLLEELEETMGNSTLTKRQVVNTHMSESSNEVKLPNPPEMSAIIENYLEQKFKEFTARSFNYLPAKQFTEIGIMTGPDEKEVEDLSGSKQVTCLPRCKCVPAKISKRKN